MLAALAVQGVVAFAAGVLLNGMPCVLPVLPFKIQALLNGTAGGARSRTLGAAALLAGSLTFFLALGTAAAGFGVMWGQPLQSVWVRRLLSLLFLAAAAATFLGWSWRLPQALYRNPVHRSGSAFVSGALTGLLATPCAGPFLGSVLAYAATRPSHEVLILFGAIGTGLALPTMVLMMWPGLLTRLSFSGRAAPAIKAGFGFALLGGGLFFGQGMLPAPMVRFAWVGWLMAVGLWLAVRLTEGRRRRWRPVLIVSWAVLVVTGYQTVQRHTPSDGLPWQAYSDQSLVEAAGRPVIIGFSADWCISCQVMAQTTFRDRDLRLAIERRGVVALKVDLTHADASSRAVFDRFGGRALPYTVILDRRGRPIRQFTGMVGAAELIKHLPAVDQ